MKILMVLENDFPPDPRVEKEALSIKEAGFEIAIASISKSVPESSDFQYKGIRMFKKKISTYTQKSVAVALQFPFYFNFWKKYISELRSVFEFDAIHVHDLPLAKVGYYFKRKFGCKLIVDLHENYPALVDASPYSKKFPGNILISIQKWEKYERNILPFADLIITVIDEMKNRIVSLGISAEKIIIISNIPVIDELVTAKGKPDKDYITLFYSGGINYHRGLQIVLKGMEELVKERKNIRLWIVGQGSYMSEISEQIRRLNLEDFVTFWGWKPFGEMIELQSQSDIALIPHLRSVQSDNSSPNKLYDYMFYRKPVLASDSLSVARILDKSQAGITYNSTDPKAFVSALRLMNNPKRLQEMGENGHKAVVEEYNWSNAEKELIEAYRNRF